MKGASVIVRVLTGGWAITALFFLVLLSILLHGVFLPGHTLFANDGPLGQLMAQCHRMPGRFTGCWEDLNSVGFNGGAASPDISSAMQWLLGPVGFSKFYAIASLWILGMSAWLYFRRTRLTPLACTLGGLAAMLNSSIFSLGCWGMSAQVITVGMFFLALAALVDTSSRQGWLRVTLAGMAVGMAVTEGADVGAIFSLFVAAFIMCQAWIAQGPRARNLAAGVVRVVLVASFAFLVASQAIHGLVETSIKGVAGTQQDAQTKAKRWDWATQWSLPKKETLSLIVPGLFGYRMDSPDGGSYWGAIGRDPAWDKYFASGGRGAPPDGLLRFSGGGDYAGIIVVLIAVWAAAQSFRRKESLFSLDHRKWLWFWLAAAVLSLLLAFGRYAPFYRLAYALPYVSTIRNPVKFIEVFSVALVVIFASGVDGLQRRYLSAVKPAPVAVWSGLQNWWSRAEKFEKIWVCGCGLVWLASLAAWMVYAHCHDALAQYLLSVGVGRESSAVASFSIHSVGWFVALFSLAIVVMVLIFNGSFAGRRAGIGVLLLGLLLLGDLGLANQPWIVYWNYPEKYASNPVIDRLRHEPYKHRVAIPPVSLPPQLMALPELYREEWLQQQFPYYDVQSFDVVEMPRMPQDLKAFLTAMVDANPTNFGPLSRAWQLTNTRYILAPVDFGDYWNTQHYLASTALRIVTRFAIVPKPGITAVTKADQLTAVLASDGNFGLFELAGALPRAKLYTRWESNTNDQAVLQQLFSPSFNPASLVFVADELPANPEVIGTDHMGGEVQFVSYAPKELVLAAEAASPSVLLLNDHYDPDWKVLVDGTPERLLRCNFFMQGVYLSPGKHRVEFKFQPPFGWLYVSLAAEATGLLILCVLLVSKATERRWASASGPQAAKPMARREIAHNRLDRTPCQSGNPKDNVPHRCKPISIPYEQQQPLPSD